MASSERAVALEFGLREKREHMWPVRYALVLGRFARRKPLGFFGLIVVLGLIGAAVFAEQLAPYDPAKLDLKHRLEGSSSLHKLGTDATGKDVLLIVCNEHCALRQENK